jgi:hypothetical protein
LFLFIFFNMYLTQIYLHFEFLLHGQKKQLEGEASLFTVGSKNDVEGKRQRFFIVDSDNHLYIQVGRYCNKYNFCVLIHQTMDKYCHELI